MTFFFDNNVGQYLVSGLKGFGEDATHLTEHFKQDAQDSEWLRKIGENGWCLMTRDERIRSRPNEIAALRQNNVGAFFLGGKNRSKCQLIMQVVRNWPRIKETAAKEKRPFAFRIPPKGTKLERIPLA